MVILRQRGLHMPDLGSLNAVDYVVIAVILVSGILATFRGITRQLLGVAGWGIAFMAALLAEPWLAIRLGLLVDGGPVLETLGFWIPFLTVLTAWYFLSNALAWVLKGVTFGSLDPFLGFLYGVLRGVVLVALVYMAGLLLLENENRFPDSVLSSASIAPTRLVASQLSGLTGGDVRKSLDKGIPDQDIGTITDGVRGAADRAKGNLLPDEELPALGQ